MLLNNDQIKLVKETISQTLINKKSSFTPEIRDTIFSDIIMDVHNLSELPTCNFREKEKDLSDKEKEERKLVIFTRIRVHTYYSNIAGFLEDNTRTRHNYRSLKSYARKQKKLGRTIRNRPRVKTDRINDTNTISTGNYDKTIKELAKFKPYSKKPLSRDPLYKANPSYYNWLSKRNLIDNNDNYIKYIEEAVSFKSNNLILKGKDIPEYKKDNMSEHPSTYHNKRYNRHKLHQDFLEGYGWDAVIAKTYDDKVIVTAEQVCNEIASARKVGRRLVNMLKRGKYGKSAT